MADPAIRHDEPVEAVAVDPATTFVYTNGETEPPVDFRAQPVVVLPSA